LSEVELSTAGTDWGAEGTVKGFAAAGSANSSRSISSHKTSKMRAPPGEPGTVVGLAGVTGIGFGLGFSSGVAGNVGGVADSSVPGLGRNVRGSTSGARGRGRHSAVAVAVQSVCPWMFEGRSVEEEEEDNDDEGADLKSNGSANFVVLSLALDATGSWLAAGLYPFLSG
jgi:hypothetical protein